MNIQESQRNAIGSMLNLSLQPGFGNNMINQSAISTSNTTTTNDIWILEGPHIWKVLIYDKVGQTILSPLMKVGSLRHHGVTLHINLNTPKSVIPEVPALYFICPTIENIDKLCEDIQNKYYESYYINFISPCSKQVLEYFAKKVIKTGNVSKITKVIDRYLDFISLSPTKYTLGMDSVYSCFHGNNRNDDSIQATIDRIVSDLTCVISCLGIIPIIRCSGNMTSPSQIIARQLDSKLRELLKQSNTNFPVITGNHRPVLILLDRDIDLSVMINHTWIYEGLIHDVYNLKLNRISIPDESNNGYKAYDLDSNDSFWRQYSGAHFTDVANAVAELLNDYNKKLAELNYNNEDSTQVASNLAIAIHALPEMTEKKRSIDIHTNIATALVNEIKKRELDKLFEIEESYDTIPTVSGCINQIDLLFTPTDSDNSKFTDIDKFRVILSLCLHERHGNNITSQNIEYLTRHFNNKAEYVGILNYVCKRRGNNSFNLSFSNSDISPNTSNVVSQNVSSGITSLAKNMGEKVFDMAGKNILQGVRALLPLTKSLKITKIIDSLLENKTNTFSTTNSQLSSSLNSEEFLYFDPKQPCQPGTDSSNVVRIKTSFKQVIVFMIGGGSFVESQAIQNYADKAQKNIIYGCTEFINPNDFIEELNKVANS
ncbi:Sec1 family protein [Cryptosporidium muris RN66]|uniref:Sec1 family protein n=1 Tax=Cryptosporidium muris (strain RN66) TaxID=441375 RepID=B6AIW1_CRYMR|nr:Sec1 family protein [Cryptosporidium muris RN66]EEA08152.1 Sec1 family protein [Cryptosporidium muris RN66]|eukprot:XP_002142501.1 Sec1 family protein [Cryptosporidium muris RN66]